MPRPGTLFFAPSRSMGQKRIPLPDGFVVLLGAMILLADLFPGPGVATGTWTLSRLATVSVPLVFFFYGLRLSPRALVNGLGNWRLHLAVQLFTFVLFPLLVLAGAPIIAASPLARFQVPLLFLAALPSTVSSSVVMVAMARGNVAAGIFNASLSSLLGIVITPLWMAGYTTGQADHAAVGGMVLALAVQVLLPLVAGLLLHARWGESARQHGAWLRRLDQAVILLIVYTSFSHSFQDGLFRDLPMGVLLGLAVVSLLLFVGVMFLGDRTARFLGLPAEDRTVLLFCGSKKSLVHGSVMAKVLFAGNPAAGLMLLPIMIYHALQLFLAAIIAQRIAANGEAAGATRP